MRGVWGVAWVAAVVVVDMEELGESVVEMENFENTRTRDLLYWCCELAAYLIPQLLYQRWRMPQLSTQLGSAALAITQNSSYLSREISNQ